MIAAYGSHLKDLAVLKVRVNRSRRLRVNRSAASMCSVMDVAVQAYS